MHRAKSDLMDAAARLYDAYGFGALDNITKGYNEKIKTIFGDNKNLLERYIISEILVNLGDKIYEKNDSVEITSLTHKILNCCGKEELKDVLNVFLSRTIFDEKRMRVFMAIHNRILNCEISPAKKENNPRLRFIIEMYNQKFNLRKECFAAFFKILIDGYIFDDDCRTLKGYTDMSKIKLYDDTLTEMGIVCFLYDGIHLQSGSADCRNLFMPFVTNDITLENFEESVKNVIKKYVSIPNFSHFNYSHGMTEGMSYNKIVLALIDAIAKGEEEETLFAQAAHTLREMNKTKGGTLHLDHIFTQAGCIENNIPKEIMNSIGNMRPLNRTKNMRQNRGVNEVRRGECDITFYKECWGEIFNSKEQIEKNTEHKHKLFINSPLFKPYINDNVSIEEKKSEKEEPTPTSNVESILEQLEFAWEN